MKKYILHLLLLALAQNAFAQTFNVSDEVDINRADMYGVVGKINDRVIFFSVEDGYATFRSFDEKMHHLSEKRIELEKRYSAKVFDVLAGKNDFCLIYQYKKKGRDFIKIEKYDGTIRLLDSATVTSFGTGFMSETPPAMSHSEDRRVVLFYHVNGKEEMEAATVSLDSLRVIQAHHFSVHSIDMSENFKEALVNNKGDMSFTWEQNNRTGVLDKHTISATEFLSGGGVMQYSLPLKDFITNDVKFVYDNLHNRIVACGLISKKGAFKTQGYFTASLNEAPNGKIGYHLFDDVFMSSVKGRKVSNNKGIDDVKIQDIALRKDGGILLFVEQVETRSRSMNNYTYAGATYAPNSYTHPLMQQTDYYYDNIFIFSTHPDCEQHWRTVLYKKQFSQNDEGAFCSFFMMKSPSALRLIFNDEVQKNTTVSEYVLNGAGQYERHTLLNTDGQNLSLRFHDAVQTGSNELIIPSEDRHRIRLLKATY